MRDPLAQCPARRSDAPWALRSTPHAASVFMVNASLMTRQFLPPGKVEPAQAAGHFRKN
jgi:hypothetical protein